MVAAARFKDLCIDAVDMPAAARFWSQALGLQLNNKEDYWWLTGPTDQHTIWVNQVPEPKQVKNRVHLDVGTGSVAELVELGAAELTVRDWTVMTDPDGQELCAFLRPQPPEYRLIDLVVDAVDPRAIATWWLQLFDGHSTISEASCCNVLGIDGLPWRNFTFLAVPEPKTVKNRVHWDVYADPDELVARGATLLRAKGGDVGWHVLADPEGNEFCVFDEQ
jgi:catechol 2,3-dioxygenase-like lactoylglutathione lyase family enzyme